MEGGRTLILVSLYFVPWTLFWDGSLPFANFSSLRRSKMISNLSFISSSNLGVGYCVSTPVCCGLIWLNFIIISKHRLYINVSIFQEEITLLSLWSGKRVVIFISLVLHSEFTTKNGNQWWYLLRQEIPIIIPTETTVHEYLKQIIHNLHPPKPWKLEIDPSKQQTPTYLKTSIKNIMKKPTHAKDESPAVGRPRDLRPWRANISL